MKKIILAVFLLSFFNFLTWSETTSNNGTTCSGGVTSDGLKCFCPLRPQYKTLGWITVESRDRCYYERLDNNTAGSMITPQVSTDGFFPKGSTTAEIPKEEPFCQGGVTPNGLKCFCPLRPQWSFSLKKLCVKKDGELCIQYGQRCVYALNSNPHTTYYSKPKAPADKSAKKTASTQPSSVVSTSSRTLKEANPLQNGSPPLSFLAPPSASAETQELVKDVNSKLSALNHEIQFLRSQIRKCEEESGAKGPSVSTSQGTQ